MADVLDAGQVAGPKDSQRAKLLLALASVYVLWGSTFLAIRVAVGGLPPLFMAGTRFCLAAVILLIAGRIAGHEVPSWRQVRNAGLIGTVMLLGGNGTVCWAEQFIPSGLGALLLASTPIWIHLGEAVMPGGARLSRNETLGVVVGLAGSALLLSRDSGGQAALPMLPQLVLLSATIFWSLGIVIGRRVSMPASGIYNSAFTLLGGGLSLVVCSGLLGEWPHVNLAASPLRAWVAFAYLVIGGSVLGFSAYSWLIQHAQPSITSTTNYVNPVVAVILGVVVLHEAVTARMVAGAVIVILAVGLTLTAKRRTLAEHT
jgi:drug/metabolite transporter (DMT)-like permease